MKTVTTLVAPVVVALLFAACKPQDQPAKKQASSQPSSQLSGPLPPPQEPPPPSGPSPSSGKNGKDEEGKDEKDGKSKDGKSKDGKSKDDEEGKDEEGKEDEKDELKGKVVVDVTGTPEGTHVPGGIACKTGYEQIGSFADCGGAICNGNQNVCVKTAKIESLKDSATIVAELSMTPEGTHAAGGVSCASGFDTIMTVADCGGGVCNGNQVICQRKITKKKAAAGKRYLKAISMTAEGTHGGASCKSGYAQIGTAADCGGGTCNGNQSVCVLPSDDE